MKKEKLNRLDLFQKSCYKDKIDRKIRERKREGVRYSKEFISDVKRIPYENIKEIKIRRLCEYSDYMLGKVNKIGGETEKYYLQLINAIKYNDSIPLEGFNNVFFSIFENIQYMYDLLGKESFEKIFNLYCNNMNEHKIEAINSIFNYITDVTEESKEFLNNIIDYLRICDDNEKIRCLKVCIDNFYYIFDNNSMANIILNNIMNSNNPSNTLYILNNVVKQDNIKNTNLVSYLLELFSKCEDKNIIIFWKRIIENKQFITSTDFDFQNKVIEFSKSKKFDDNKYITNEYADIVLELQLMDKKDMQDSILNKLSTLQNIRSVVLLDRLILILNDYSNINSVSKVLNNLEDDKGNLTKRLVIDLK